MPFFSVRTALGFALIVVIGAQTALLQLLAWSGMVVNYSQQHSLSEAVEMTFDGEHPCPFCEMAQQQTEKKHDPQQPSAGAEKVVLLCEMPAAVILPVFPPSSQTEESSPPLQIIRLEPPVPPPRFLI